MVCSKQAEIHIIKGSTTKSLMTIIIVTEL